MKFQALKRCGALGGGDHEANKRLSFALKISKNRIMFHNIRGRTWINHPNRWGCYQKLIFFFRNPSEVFAIIDFPTHSVYFLSLIGWKLPVELRPTEARERFSGATWWPKVCVMTHEMISSGNWRNDCIGYGRTHVWKGKSLRNCESC